MSLLPPTRIITTKCSHQIANKKSGFRPKNGDPDHQLSTTQTRKHISHFHIKHTNFEIFPEGEFLKHFSKMMHYLLKMLHHAVLNISEDKNRK